MIPSARTATADYLNKARMTCVLESWGHCFTTSHTQLIACDLLSWQPFRLQMKTALHMYRMQYNQDSLREEAPICRTRGRGLILTSYFAGA